MNPVRCAHADTAHHPAGMPLPGYGLPQERMARMAAQATFAELKNSFMRASLEIEGGLGLLLQRQVMLTREATELWRLRGAVLAALPAQSERSRLHRDALSEQLGSVFHQCEHINGFGSR